MPPITNVEQLKQTLRDSLAALQESAAFILASHQGLTPPQAVDIGQLLWWISEQSVWPLDVLKENLRTHNATIHQGMPGTYHLQGEENTSCTVTVPSVSVKLRAGVDIPSLKRTMGNLFDTYIATDTTFKIAKNFQTQIAKDTTGIAKPLADAVTLEEGTPRITFKSAKVR